MSSRQIDHQKIATAMRRAGAGANLDVAVAFYRAPTLAGELAGRCSADLLGELSDRIAALRSEITPLEPDFNVLGRVERLQKLAAPVGAVVGLFAGSLLFGLVESPSGFIIGLLFPGAVLALILPYVLRKLLLICTIAGRNAVRMAYAVHLRTQETAAHWQSLTWREFEIEVADLFRRLRFSVDHTGGAGDQGVDIVATQGNTKLLIQCKKHGTPVGPAVIRELVGTLVLQKSERGVLISSSGFTPSATDAADGMNVVLLDIHDLLQIHKRGSLEGYLSP